MCKECKMPLIFHHNGPKIPLYSKFLGKPMNVYTLNTAQWSWSCTILKSLDRYLHMCARCSPPAHIGDAGSPGQPACHTSMIILSQSSATVYTTNTSCLVAKILLQNHLLKWQEGTTREKQVWTSTPWGGVPGIWLALVKTADPVGHRAHSV